MYEYYEYADGSTEAEYVEEKAEEALANIPNQLSKRRRRRRQVDYSSEGADSEENVRLLCCSFQKYLHCSETVVNTTCGYETAQFTKSFLDRMSGPLIQVSPWDYTVHCTSAVCLHFMFHSRVIVKLTNMAQMDVYQTVLGTNTINTAPNPTTLAIKTLP